MTAPRPTLPSSSTDAFPSAGTNVVLTNDAAALAGARATLYRFLSAATLAPPTQEAVNALANEGYGGMLAALLEDPRLDAALAALRRAPATPEELAREYVRLFTVPGPDYLAPYAAMFDPSTPPEGRLLYGAATRAVLRAYAASGYRPAPGFDELPDHIGAVLAFLAFLCDDQRTRLEAGDLDGAEASTRAQWEFIDTQLAWFGPGVADALEARTTSPWFLCLAALLRAVALAEAAGGDRSDRPAS